MNRQLLVFITAVVLVAAIWRGCTSSKNSDVAEDAPAESVKTEAPVVVSDASTPTAPVAPTSGTTTAAPAAPTESAPENLETMKAQFGKALSEINACLGINAQSSEGADPTVENWVGAMKGDLGDPVLQTEDWTNVQLKVGDETRRIRVSMDYSGEERIVRRLSYEKILPDGTYEPLPLSQEQSEDPNDTLIASVESDGQVVNRERSQRIYFSGGEEVVVVEKNGRIAELEMSRNGKTYHCAPNDPSPDACKCMQ